MGTAADIFWLVVSVAMVVGLFVLARRFDPLHSSADGSSFQCRAELIALDGAGSGQHKVRAQIDGNRVIVFDSKFARADPGQQFFVQGRSERPPRGSSVYVVGDEGIAMALTVKRGSPPDRRLAELL